MHFCAKYPFRSAGNNLKSCTFSGLSLMAWNAFHCLIFGSNCSTTRKSDQKILYPPPRDPYPLFSSMWHVWLRNFVNGFDPFNMIRKNLGFKNSPGMDLPSSRYSRTEGLRKFSGISGRSFSWLPLSSFSRSCWGSGSKLTGSGARGRFARLERTVSRQSASK